MLWACVLLPQLALDDVLRGRPPSDEPLVLVGGPANGRIVVAVNLSARAAGMYRGQRLSAAQALLNRFEMVEYDPAATLRAHRMLAAWAYGYSSDVALLPHAVVFEAGSSLKLFGQWADMEPALRRSLDDQGFRHRITLAPNAHAAHVLAGVRDGLAVTSVDELRRTLAPMPLQRARLPEGAADALASMGVRTFGQLMGLPRAGLQRRFGAMLLDYMDALVGDAPATLESFRPPDSLDLRMEWAHEVEQSGALVFPLRRLTGDLAAYLAGRDGGVQRFVVELEHRSGPPTCMPVGLLAAERDARLLFDCARERLERQALPSSVVAMRLIASELPPFVPGGRDLFDTRPANAMPLDQLRGRLLARLGEKAIYRLGRTVDPRPEYAQAREPTAPVPTPETSPRPTWLLDHPIPLRDAPSAVICGPERLETGWWDGDIRRDYYVVRTAQGQRAWVYRAPDEPGRWMLHGWFA